MDGNETPHKWKHDPMKYFARFVEEKPDKTINTALGSDSVFQLDGRNMLRIMIVDCIRRMEQLKAVHPGYLGFRIYKGDLRSARMVHSSISSEQALYYSLDKGLKEVFDDQP